MNLNADEWIGLGIAATGVGVWLLLGVVSYALATSRKSSGNGGGGSGWAQRLQREPVVVRTAVLALIAVGGSFGLSVTNEQQVLIVGAVLAVLPLFAWRTRAQVTPVAAPRVEE